MTQYSTGLELVLNACEGTLQIVVTDDEQPLCYQEWRIARRGTEILVPALKEIFGRLGITARQLRRIACMAGPGSFTGIRLVLTTAAAIRRATAAQLASIDYMQSLATTASMWRGLLYPQKICVITHARRNLVHYQEFASYGPQIPAQPLAPVELIEPAKALSRISVAPCYVCGGGIARNPEYFAQPVTGKGPEGAPEAVMLPNLTDPNLAALCLLARHGDYFPRDVEPKYVRQCDAVENLQESAQAEGENGDRLREELDRLLQNGSHIEE